MKIFPFLFTGGGDENGDRHEKPFCDHPSFLFIQYIDEGWNEGRKEMEEQEVFKMMMNCMTKIWEEEELQRKRCLDAKKKEFFLINEQEKKVFPLLKLETLFICFFQLFCVYIFNILIIIYLLSFHG